MVAKLSAYKIDPESIIGIDSLNKIFERNKHPKTCTYRGDCNICGCSLKIEIAKTSGGYGLNGGVLYEPDPERYVALCIDCYEGFGKRQCCTNNCASS